MILLIERTAERIESRYGLSRRFELGNEYCVPRMVEQVQVMAGSVAVEPHKEHVIRHLETDFRTETRMEHKTAQFFLRNLPFHKVEQFQRQH